MYVFLILIAFFIPIHFRKYFYKLQVTLGIIWFVAIITTPSYYPPSYYQQITERLVYILIPSWVFGSLIALSLNFQETSQKVRQLHETLYHHIKKNN